MQKQSTYFFPLMLLMSIILGGITGHYFGQYTPYLKPFGELFLNLIFTAIVPLIFFSISSAIARNGSAGKWGSIFFYMVIVFIFTSLVAAVSTVFIVTLFPPAQGVQLALTISEQPSNVSFASHLVGIFTVPDFSQLLSHEHILPLIVFSILVGLAAGKSTENSSRFATFLHAGEDVFMRVFAIIMYYAPIGFFAYFSVMVNELGPKLMESYLRITVLYYVFGVLYFIIAFTAFAYLAGRIQGVTLFWRHIFLPAVTAIATCSSAASIPANLLATQKMRVAPEIYETVVPLGMMIHKDGSVIGGVFKIAFLFGIFHMSFAGTLVLLKAIGISMLVGTVMAAIPSGGMLGELLILSLYGFPPSVLIAVAAISIIIDPLATMINVTCNSVGSLMIARLVTGTNWYRKTS